MLMYMRTLHHPHLTRLESASDEQDQQDHKDQDQDSVEHALSPSDSAATIDTMSVLLDYNETVEILPGVNRRVYDCTIDDLDMATECELLRRDLRVKAETLLSEAAHYGIAIPDDLRDQLALCLGDTPTLVGLVDELAEIVRPGLVAA